MGGLDGTVVDHKGISLRTVAAKDGGAVKRQIQGFCEAKAGVSKEANLVVSIPGRRIKATGRLTPLWPDGSRALPQAFILGRVSARSR